MTPADDIRDIHGPIVTHAHAWWPYVVIAAALVLIVLVARRLLRRAPATPAETALRDLAAAKTQIAEGQAEAFSTHVSNAVRAYVERAFGVHAPRRTTEELLADLMVDGSPVAAHRDELGAFLGFCDLAKYARWSLSTTEMNGMVASAEAFVRATAGGAA